ncbi:MAG TPA: plastocyanin/azurin family copper-binding protein [Gaiellaceae bacterium]
MPRLRLSLAAAFAVAIAPLPAGAAHRDNPVLDAIVGTNDAFEITLNDGSGQKVFVLAPGTYTVVVHDRSRIHNFHLASNTDPTVDFRTDVEFVGDQTFTVTFHDNTRYAYACEPHWQTMNGSFFVTSRSSSPPPPPPPPAPVRRLTGTVSAGGAVSLDRSSVTAGRYRLTVTDRSKRQNFHMVGPGLDRRTGAKFVGVVRWNVKLVRGMYVYGSDRGRAKRRLHVR